MKRRFSVDILRLILVFFVCVISDGGAFGILQPIAGFATIAFFILAGYYTLHEGADFEKRLTRGIKRAGVMFGVMLVLYAVMNAIYLTALDIGFFTPLKGWRVWFEILVLNVWPMPFGSSIWFVQTLLYVYIGMYFLNKRHILEMKWLDYFMLAVSLIFAVLSGELAELTGIHIFNYAYIPGNFFTRALPGLLAGRLIWRHRDFLRRISLYVYPVTAIIGVLASVGELLLLSKLGVLTYTGHMMGNGILAFSLVLFALNLPEYGEVPFLRYSSATAKFVYVSHEMLSYLIMWMFVVKAPTDAGELAALMPVILFVISLGIVGVYALIMTRREKKEELRHRFDR